MYVIHELKIFWGETVAVSKWKFVNEIFSVTRGLQVSKDHHAFPPLSTMKYICIYCSPSKERHVSEICCEVRQVMGHGMGWEGRYLSNYNQSSNKN